MDNLGKVIAVIFVILFLWVGYPHFARGEWIAPTAISPGNWWLAQTPQYRYLGKPTQGYGWFRFDFWNAPPVTGRPVYQSDFRL